MKDLELMIIPLLLMSPSKFLLRNSLQENYIAWNLVFKLNEVAMTTLAGTHRTLPG